MAENKVQYQHGFSLDEFYQKFGTEQQCEEELERTRWPEGFKCPQCGSKSYGVIHDKRRKRYQCKSCRHQASLTAGTIFESTKLALRTWFQAVYMISQAKTGISALSLKRYLGVSYPTSWKIRHKLMHAMKQRDDRYLLSGVVQMDDAYLGGELSGGKAGRGSENKVPFVAAVQFDSENHPFRIKMSQVKGFTSKAILDWAQGHIILGSTVITDGLACFNAVTDAGCKHIAKVVGGLKPKDLPLFQWLNTILGNVKTGLSGTYHAFKFGKYGNRYMGEIAYRFNRRFHLQSLHQRLLVASVACAPCPERLLRSAEDCC